METLAMTMTGITLARQLPSLKAGGLDLWNMSLDILRSQPSLISSVEGKVSFVYAFCVSPFQLGH